MKDANIQSWSVDQSPIVIEYSLVALEEIRHEVIRGFQKLSRGGLDVGGVLYGNRDGRTIRILAMRPIQCEHAHGPAFLLSDDDRRLLAEGLKSDGTDPSLHGFVCLGWFVSHPRAEIQLTASDLEIYEKFFPSPWQVTMVIRPARGGAMRAGFFVREADGSVNGGRSYQEFNFPDRLAGVLDRTQRPERRIPERPAPDFSQAPVPAGVSQADSPPPVSFPEVPQFLPVRPRRRNWLWLAAWVAVVLSVSVLGLRYFFEVAESQPVSLTLVEREGQLMIEWNGSASPVTAAARGALIIDEGQETKRIELAPSDLTAGRFSYARKSGDIEVRLIVQAPDGATVQEASRYLGPPPVAQSDPDETNALEQEKAQLEEQIKRLQSTNSAQAQRIQQLERTLRILQTRLGIDAQE
jgi:hypothetical protein